MPRACLLRRGLVVFFHDFCRQQRREVLPRRGCWNLGRLGWREWLHHLRLQDGDEVADRAAGLSLAVPVSRVCLRRDFFNRRNLHNFLGTLSVALDRPRIRRLVVLYLEHLATGCVRAAHALTPQLGVDLIATTATRAINDYVHTLTRQDEGDRKRINLILDQIAWSWNSQLAAQILFLQQPIGRLIRLAHPVNYFVRLWRILQLNADGAVDRQRLDLA